MSKEIKSLLLSAGLGTRLRPLTKNIPKCLVEINQKPILEHWLIKLENIGCNATLVNTHYFHEKVHNYLYERKISNMFIKEIFEEKLLGTAGTLIENANFFKNSKIIMLHADNMTNFNLNELIEADKNRPPNCLLTMLTFKTQNPKSAGIIVKDKFNILKEFYEKVENPPSNIANAAIYIFDYEFIERLQSDFPKAKDFSKDVIPKLIGKIYLHHTNDLLIDIGTKENLIKAINKFTI